jgi:beta-ureidopropionase / N-carbamoyl-L-amino-acid hydrolase
MAFGHNSINQPILDFAQEIFSLLDQQWVDDQRGMNRMGYSQEEQKAIDNLVSLSKDLNLEVYQDSVGNIYIVLPGQNRNKKVLLAGSHIDAVKLGGRYDGTTGVVIGLATAKALIDNKIECDADFVIVIWRCEESPAFRKACLGSSLATKSDLSLLSLYSEYYQKDLSTLLTEKGFDLDQLRKHYCNKNIIFPSNAVSKAIEIHIEQSDLSQRKGSCDLAIASAIRGHVRTKSYIFITGEAGHSGTVPQSERKDAFLAALYFFEDFKKLAEAFEKNGQDIVYTCPIFETLPYASATTIPDKVRFYVEVRSQDVEVLNAFDHFLKNYPRVFANSCIYEAPEILTMAPVIFDEDLMEKIESLALSLGIKTTRVLSGATHDIGNLKNLSIPSSLIFVPHGHQGLSHHPQETLSLESFENPFLVGSPFWKALSMLYSIVIREEAEICLDESFVNQLLISGAKKLV